MAHVIKNTLINIFAIILMANALTEKITLFSPKIMGQNDHFPPN